MIFMDKEFEEKCLKERIIKQSPTVTIIKRKELMKSIAEQHKNNSEYFLEAAKILSKSNAPLVSYIVGYFAMEHKANELLVLNGYKVESHICTQICLSRILGYKNLAKTLSVIFNLRQAVGYRMFLKYGESEKENARKVMEENIMPFIEEVDGLIKSKKMFY